MGRDEMRTGRGWGGEEHGQNMFFEFFFKKGRNLS